MRLATLLLALCLTVLSLSSRVLADSVSAPAGDHFFLRNVGSMPLCSLQITRETLTFSLLHARPPYLCHYIIGSKGYDGPSGKLVDTRATQPAPVLMF
jgi:hypothetical protein